MKTGCLRVAVAAALWAAPAGADPPPCYCETELRPSEAMVGQQVLWRVRIFSRDDVVGISWTTPPAFADVRTEPLPGRPEAEATARAGRSYRSREEHRALFAERPGEIEIRSSGLRCTLADGEIAEVPVPTAVLGVHEPPESGRPSHFTGVIGPLVVATHLDPASVTLGESARVIVSLRGSANLWDVPDPLAGVSLGGAELFQRPVELNLRPGTTLSVQRIFRYDVVPHEEGVLAIPALRVSHYDAAAGRYAVAESAPLELVVGPRARSSRAAPRPGSPREPRRPDDAAEPGSLAVLGLVAALAVAALGGVQLIRGRRRRSVALAALEAAAPARAAGDRDGEAAALTRALRIALGRHIDGAGSASPADLLAASGLDPAVAAAVRVLDEVERSRFDPRAPAPDAAAVERVIANL